MKPIKLFVICLVLFSGCATTGTEKVVIWETKDISRTHEVLGPVNVSEDITESNVDMFRGLAGYIAKDGRISEQLPADMKAMLDEKKQQYKEGIFEKLGQKAKEYGADAVIGAEYNYLPPYVSFSDKARVTAQGTMVKYK